MYNQPRLGRGTIIHLMLRLSIEIRYFCVFPFKLLKTKNVLYMYHLLFWGGFFFLIIYMDTVAGHFFYIFHNYVIKKIVF